MSGMKNNPDKFSKSEKWANAILFLFHILLAVLQVTFIVLKIYIPAIFSWGIALLPAIIYLSCMAVLVFACVFLDKGIDDGDSEAENYDDEQE